MSQSPVKFCRGESKNLRGYLGAAVSLTVFYLAPPVCASTFTTLYTFNGAQPIGSPQLNAPVTFDPTGKFLYGEGYWGGAHSLPITSGTTPIGNGFLFKLAPPPGGGTPWRLTVLFNFDKQGRNPIGGLTLDPKSGLLYGVTKNGGPHATNDGNGNGTIFRLNPNGTKPVVNTIANFSGYNGSDPMGGVTLDPSGNLFGATLAGGDGYDPNKTSYGKEIGNISGAGLVYKLASDPTGVLGHPTIPHRFHVDGPTVPYAAVTGVQPMGQLARDASGNLYGVTNRSGSTQGTVFMLRPTASGGWTCRFLYRFGQNYYINHQPDGSMPEAGVILDATGNIYGTTAFGGASTDGAVVGTVFKLSLHAGKWTETILHSFGTIPADGSYPSTELVFAKGVLYGATRGGGSGGQGTIFSLTPPPAGKTNWTYKIEHAFQGRADGGFPRARMVVDAAGNLYGTTSADGNGTIFKLTP